MAKNIVKTGVYTKDGSDFSFDFHTSLPASKKVTFVDSMSKSLIDKNRNNYNYIIRDMMFDFYLVISMTDVDVSDIAREGDVDVIEEFLDSTNIVDIVKKNAEPGFIQELSDAVDLNLEYRTGVKIDPIAKALSSLLNTIEGKIPEYDMDKMFEISDALSGISGELTADKMLEAYMNNDGFKKYILENSKAFANPISPTPISLA